MNHYMMQYIATAGIPRKPEAGETEIVIGKNISAKAYDLLCRYGLRDWVDEQGRQHVIIDTSRIEEIETA